MGRKKTTEEFKKEVFNLIGDEYTVLGEYIRSQTKILMQHTICKHIWEVQPGAFLSGNRCPKCSNRGRRPKTTEQFKEDVYNLIGDEYIVLGQYKNNQTKILVLHNECGFEWEVRPNDFLRGNRCPKCSRKISRGEKRIMNFLRGLKIPFSYEHKFNDLIDKKHLRFDFYLEEHNLCIEYDGRQHFKAHDFSGKDQESADKKFIITQKHDKMKNAYCENNSIKLFRIPYTDYNNINKILKKELK